MTPFRRPVRIAAVQHGDFSAAQRSIARGEPESYFGISHAVGAVERLVEGKPHLIVSLGAPAGSERTPLGENVGCPKPSWGRVPGTVAEWVWAGRWIEHLDRFRPTHLLLRAGGLPATRLLAWAARKHVTVMTIFHGYFDRERRYFRLVNARLANLLNRPNVYRVGNHRRPAADSMIACGVDPRKVVAFDWPGRPNPVNYAPRHLNAGPEPELFYAGIVDRAKGVFDLTDAVRRLRARGIGARLTVAGAGPDVANLTAEAARLPAGAVNFLGVVPNTEVFARMRAADVVCVPSRREFTEGFPKTLTEGLASRTPVVISDHPVFVAALTGTAGVRWFRGGDAGDLANTVATLLTDPVLYRATSEAAAEAFSREECPNTFGDLLADWQRTL
ncbi:glycosyltransferase [Fimbriiglobus ruber]|uniref:Glycosyl transferase, group 1 family protein n=1 Tax=Fimbriiglobus ruber TaxID=1908690 RepID=A0A225DCP6_9BACT|nr:glycosyltransferase [Fimbriiglobus ruber]OWK34165.1 Glycosyl transferase, group 1 family protein [Fimbriiglobus ruber]